MCCSAPEQFNDDEHTEDNGSQTHVCSSAERQLHFAIAIAERHDLGCVTDALQDQACNQAGEAAVQRALHYQGYRWPIMSIQTDIEVRVCSKVRL